MASERLRPNRGQREEEETATALLAPFIDEVVAIFDAAGYRRLEGITIKVSEHEGGEGRHFGACRTDGRLIYFRPALVHLEQAQILGIIAHELGHALDFNYPGLFVRTSDGRMRLADSSKRGVPTGEQPIPQAWIDDWEARDDDEIERAADAIAETVLGVKIGYAGPCLIQTLGRGVRPRPLGLR